jgi:hypothetical protein
MVLQKQMLTAILLTSLLFSWRGLKAQSPVTEIGNSTNYGVYADDGASPSDDQNVLINNNSIPSTPIGAGFNQIISASARLNFLGGENNRIDPMSGNEAIANLVYGKTNTVKKNSSYNLGFGVGNVLENSQRSLAIGKDNSVSGCMDCAGIGENLTLTDGNNTYSIGANVENDNVNSLVLGFGTQSNDLTGVGSNSLSFGTNARNTFNIRPGNTTNNFGEPVTGIGISDPNAKLEIQINDGDFNSAKVLSVLADDDRPLFNIRPDGAAGFNLPADPNRPRAPYQFEETGLRPFKEDGTTLPGGEANIVQNYHSFPFFQSTGPSEGAAKWLALGERPPGVDTTQVAYGLANVWDNNAGNFVLLEEDPQDSDDEAVKDLAITFQDVGPNGELTDDGGRNRIRFLFRNSQPIEGDPNTPASDEAIYELMSLEPTGEVAVGDYSDNSVSPDASRLEVKTESTCNGCGNPETIMEVLRNKNPSNTSGDELLTVRDNGFVGVQTGSRLVVSGNPKTEEFQVNGQGFSFSWNQPSDMRIKNDTSIIDNPVEKVTQLQGITYRYDTMHSKIKHWNTPKGKQAGVIAQQLKEVLPEAVSGSEKGLYKVSYNQIIPLLIETNKAQQKQIEKLKKKTESVKSLCNKVEKLQQQIQQMHKREGAKRFKRSGDQTLNQKTVTIGDDNQAKAMLLQNRPNPYNDKTTIPYYLPKDFKQATMLITNINGQLVRRVTLEQSGKGELTLRTEGLNAGQYIYSLILDGRKIQSRKMVVNQ